MHLAATENQRAAAVQLRPHCRHRPRARVLAHTAAALLSPLLLAACVANRVPTGPVTGAHAPRPSVAERLGFAKDAKLLIIHADDLGLCQSVNQATFEALDRGWITSASLMMPAPWSMQAVQLARARPTADIGVHLTLNSEWEPMRWGPSSTRGGVASLIDSTGYLWRSQREVAANALMADIEREAQQQLELALQLGLTVSHLDTHMLTLLWNRELAARYRDLGATYHLPLLYPDQAAALTDGKLINPDQAPVNRVLAMLPGVAFDDWHAAYKAMLTDLAPGVYELIVHLGRADAELVALTGADTAWGARWRQADLDVVSSSAFRAFLREQGFVLISWRDLGGVKS